MLGFETYRNISTSDLERAMRSNYMKGLAAGFVCGVCFTFVLTVLL